MTARELRRRAAMSRVVAVLRRGVVDACDVDTYDLLPPGTRRHLEHGSATLARTPAV
jgi:hypothetical protein